MMKKLFSSIVAVALVLSVATPAAFADTTVGNQGNGVDSTNKTSVNQSNSTTVSQENVAKINNDISVKSSTGGNTASKNTNGDVVIGTGSAQTTVAIQNMANKNAAQVDPCCQAAGDVKVLNGGNGDSSLNKAELNSANATGLFQNNVADLNNKVNVDTNTGKNKADKNTGGDVSVTTGDALVGLQIGNAANENRAVIGGGMNAAHNGDLTLVNDGNGVDSHNSVKANFANSSTALQTNAAAIENYIGVKTNTGKNSANSNTGGDVEIGTGASAVLAALDNRANFNAASLDNCGCVGFGDTKVVNGGNGDSTHNYATLDKVNATEAFQANLSDINNHGWFDHNTGYNKANSNTGAYGYYNDPAVTTGDSIVDVAAETTANENLLNSGSVQMPTPPSSTSGNGTWWAWMYGMNW